MRHEIFDTGGTEWPSAPYDKVAVIGAGSWGTALALTLARAGAETRLWSRDAVQADAMQAQRENRRYLAGVAFPPNLRVGSDLAEAVAGVDAVLIVVPSGSVRAVCEQLSTVLGRECPVALCAKGVEAETGLLMSDVATQVLGSRPVGAVSGPTFARETALNHPTAATVAFPFTHTDRLDPGASAAARLAVTLSTKNFRAYVSDDLVGVEVGGAVKNVIAIACGMMSGAGFAENTKAALITRGLDEMKVLAEALGGRRETVTGLSGVGDLSLTCASTTSRNMALGQQLGQGMARPECFGGDPVVVEGEANAKSITDLARRVSVSMPICETVRAILHDGADLGAAFEALWSRPIEAEPRAMAVSFPHPAAIEKTTKVLGVVG